MNQLNLLLMTFIAIFAFIPSGNAGWQDQAHTYAIPTIAAYVVAQKLVFDQPHVVSTGWKILLFLTALVFLALIGLICWDGPSNTMNAQKGAIGLYYLRISFGLLCVPCFALALSQKREDGLMGSLVWLGKKLALSATPTAIIFIIGIVGARCFEISIGCPT